MGRGHSVIINLDEVGGRGTHWVAARLLNDCLYYADPFGTLLGGWPPNELRGLGKRRIINRRVFQRPSSNLCGYYAILFALAMDAMQKEMTQDQYEAMLLLAIK